MVKCTPTQRMALEKYFNNVGYVPGFNSTREFNTFTISSISLSLCDMYGLSKGKSLMKFIDEGDPKKVGKLLNDLLDHYEMNCPEVKENNENLHATCRSIAAQFFPKPYSTEIISKPIPLKEDIFQSNEILPQHSIDKEISKQIYDGIIPKPIPWNEYAHKSMNEYQKLLEDHGDDEVKFQHFFERNPSYVPGAFSMDITSGHSPHMRSLISQPNLQGIFKRIPDFLWLAKASDSFYPIFIEIESPNKRIFKKDGGRTADFTHAEDQLKEWAAILENPATRQLFYDRFNIPDYYRKFAFKPRYCLIYGRRSEFEGDAILTIKRSQLLTYPYHLVSYDGLASDPKADELFCSTVKDTKYYIKSISPMFQYHGSDGNYLVNLLNFKESINTMKYTTDERKKFLLERYEFWINHFRDAKSSPFSLKNISLFGGVNE